MFVTYTLCEIQKYLGDIVFAMTIYLSSSLVFVSDFIFAANVIVTVSLFQATGKNEVECCNALRVCVCVCVSINEKTGKVSMTDCFRTHYIDLHVRTLHCTT